MSKLRIEHFETKWLKRAGETTDPCGTPAISSLPWSRGFPAFKIGIMTEFIQIAVMSTPASERLKSSVRKARLCPPRWRRWSTVSLSGPWAVEEPTFLMAAATPLSLNDLNEGSTRWWYLMSLLCVRSFWAERAVNCLCNRLQTGVGFFSKEIEIFGGGLYFLLPSFGSRDQ